MANFQINTITGKDSKRGTSFVGVTTVSSTGSMRIPSGPTEHRGGRGRGFFGGGYGASSPYPELNVIDMIEVATLGNATDFGDLTTGRNSAAACSSSTRGVWGGGRDPSPETNYNVIDYIQFASTGNALDFGDTDRTTGSSNASKEARSMCGISNGHGGLG